MTADKMNVWFMTGLLGLLIWGSILVVHLLQVYSSDPGNRWTHQEMLLPLAETSATVELLIDRQMLQKHLSDGRLFLQDQQGEYRQLQPGEVMARVNNWPEQRATMATFALLPAFFSGVSLTLLLVGLAGKYRRQDGREPTR